MTPRCSEVIRAILPLKFQRELNNARRFASRHDRLSIDRRYRNATCLREYRRGEGGRAYRGIARIIKVRVIERIEHLSSELHLETLGDLERLDESQIEIPVMRRRVDVSTCAIRSGCRKSERAIVRKQHGANHVRNILQTRPNSRIQHRRTRVMRVIGCSRTAVNTERLTRHVRENAVNGPAS